jgi:hypothetical protein
MAASRSALDGAVALEADTHRAASSRPRLLALILAQEPIGATAASPSPAAHVSSSVRSRPNCAYCFPAERDADAANSSWRDLSLATRPS